MLLTAKGKMIRTSIESISKTGKNTQGVRIVKLDNDDKVVSVAKTPSQKEEELLLEE
jgi:DNA gyrase subunit A